MAKKDMTQMIVEMDSSLHTEFKHLCIDESVSMTAVVRQCIKKWIDDKNKKVVY